MSRSILFSFGSLMVLFNCTAAYGQGCGATLSPNFSIYTSISRDGKKIYTSVTMQGYASVSPSAGCNMNSATHKAEAYNTIGGTGGPNYSGSSCPSCYYSVTNNQQIVGTPGVNYNFVWDGQAICSIAGTFFGNGGNGNVAGCVAPSTETTAVEATVFTTETDFNQTISDSAGDTFNGSTVTEGNAAPGQDTCWGTWSQGPRFTGIPTTPWTVAGGQVVGQPNHWGFDDVGWIQKAVDYYRVQSPAHGVAIPCGFTGYQSMKISCPSGLTATYTPSFGNKLTGTIEQHNVINCRYDMNNTACQTINY
jgi:hypothetical protein